MCRFKSGIILKDRVFVPDYDSHTEMLEELKIADTEDNAKRLFVRAELVPPDEDVFMPVSSWKYHVDQDILPDWYVTEVDEMRMREAVTEWAKKHIHVGEKIERIDSGTHWIKDCEVENIYGSAEVGNICGSARVGIICGSAEVGNIYDSAEVGNICGSAEVGNICGSARVGIICGSAEVGNIYDSAEVGNICGSAEVGNIFDSAKVRRIYGSAEVGNIYDSAEVGRIYGSAKVTIDYFDWKNMDSVCMKGYALLIDRHNKKIYHSGAFETVITGGEENE